MDTIRSKGAELSSGLSKNVTASGKGLGRSALFSRRFSNIVETAVCLFLLLSACTGRAVVVVWDNGGGGYLWSNGTNWNPDLPGAPTATEEITIGAACDATHPVLINSPASALSVQVGPTYGVGYLSLQSDLTIVSNLTVHYKGVGTVTHSSGTLTTSAFNFGNSSTIQGSGTYTLSGTGAIQTGAVGANGGTGFVFKQAGANTIVNVIGSMALGSSAGASDRWRYELSAGSLTVTGGVSRNYGSFLFEQTGGSVSIGTSLSLGNNYRPTATLPPSEWIISGASTLSVGTDVTLGWVGDGNFAVHPGNNCRGRFVLNGSKGSGSHVTVGGNWRQTGSGTPNTTGSLGTLKGVIDDAAIASPSAMRKVAVTGNVTFDSGSIVLPEFATAVSSLPTAPKTWTLLSWGGSLTNNGLILDPAVNAALWSFAISGKSLTVTYKPQSTLITIR